MKRLIIISTVIFLLLTGCNKQDKMVLIGNSSNSNLVKVEICNTNREVLGSTDVKGNTFKVVVTDIKYPKLGFIKLMFADKKRKTRTKRCIIEKATIHVNIDSNLSISAFRGGKLNQELINSWEESTAYKGAVKSLQDFMKSGRNIYFSKHTLLETKLQLKEMYDTLKKKVKEIKRDILEQKLAENTAAIQLIIIQQVGVNNNNRKYLDKIEKEFGKSAILEELRRKEAILLENQKKDAALSVGKIIPDFKLKTPKGKNIELSSVIHKNKYTLIQFEDFSYYRSKDGYKQLRESYKKCKKKGLEIISVAITKDKKAWIENISKHKLSWIQCSDLKGKKSGLMDIYRIKKINNLPINFLVNNKGVIVEKNIAAYKFREKFKTLFRK